MLCRAPPPPLKQLRIAHLLFVLKRQLFHGDFEGFVLLRQGVQGLPSFLIRIVGPGFCVSVLFLCCAETSLSVVEEALKFAQLCSYHISVCRVRKRGVARCGRQRNFHNISRTVAGLTLARTLTSTSTSVSWPLAESRGLPSSH